MRCAALLLVGVDVEPVRVLDRLGAVIGDQPLDGGEARVGRRVEAAGVEVRVGVLEGAAAALNPGYLSRMTRGRPFVRSKLAVSLDGRTALAGGESQWITGEAARGEIGRAHV